MMKTALLSAALAGAATALQVPGRLAPLPTALPTPAPQAQPQRRQLVGVPPADDMPDNCREAAEALSSALPAEPTAIGDFSSSFYKTVSRTASETYNDCAWITEMPESMYTEYTDYADDVVDWMNGGQDNTRLLLDAGMECMEYAESGGLDEQPCSDEWNMFLFEAMEETGWTPKTLDPDIPDEYLSGSGSGSGSSSGPGSSSDDSDASDGLDFTDSSSDDSGDADSAAARVAGGTFAAAAALATFFGGVALL